MLRKLIVVKLLLVLIMPAFAQQIDDALLVDLYQSQRFGEAADYLKKAYPEPITNSKALSRLAYTSLMAGKLVDAENYYQRIYSTDSNSVSALYSLASIAARKENNLKARQYYEKIIQRDSSNYIVYKALARLNAGESQDLGKYVYYLQKANKLNPEDADVASDLSDFYVGLKQYALAEKVLSKAVDVDPENVQLLQSMLKLSSQQGKHLQSIKTGEKLLSLGDHSYYTMSGLLEAYYYNKNYQCALETFAQVDEKVLNERIYYFAAATYKALKNHPKAIELLHKAIDDGISPSIDAYYGEIADSYEQLKQNKNALYAYQKALQFDDKPMTLYAMASLYDKMENKRQAISYYKKYLAAKPPAKQQSYITYSNSRITELSR